MIRLLLNAFAVLLLVRLLFWIARLFLSSGRHGDVSGGGGGDGPRASDSGRRRTRDGRRERLDRSSVTDVPFTEVPPERAAQPREDVPPPREAP